MIYHEPTKFEWAGFIFVMCFWAFLGFIFFNMWVYNIVFIDIQKYVFNPAGLVGWIFGGFFSFILFIQAHPTMNQS